MGLVGGKTSGTHVLLELLDLDVAEPDGLAFGLEGEEEKREKAKDHHRATLPIAAALGELLGGGFGVGEFGDFGEGEVGVERG